MNERRKHRSNEPHEAVHLYLDALRKKAGVEAVALTTEQGELIAGVGALDVEWMGSLAASCRLACFAWDDRVIHVRRLEVNHVPMYLTTAGGPAHDEAIGSIQRIFGTPAADQAAA